MDEQEARTRCAELAATHVDRATHTWLPRRLEGDVWSVVKVGLSPPADDLVGEQRAETRPSSADDPRTAHDRNVGNWVGPG